jgi:hypothetical protein
MKPRERSAHCHLVEGLGAVLVHADRLQPFAEEVLILQPKIPAEIASQTKPEIALQQIKAARAAGLPECCPGACRRRGKRSLGGRAVRLALLTFCPPADAGRPSRDRAEPAARRGVIVD